MAEALKTRKSVKALPCKLSDDEVRLRGIDLAEAAKEHIDLQDAKKVTAKVFKDRIDAINKKIFELKDAVRNAVEVREIECELQYDYYMGKVTIVRMDSGEIIEVRAMTPKETQGDLFDEN